MLKRRYGIPHTIPDGGYNITFWLFGDGYMERERYDDRLCFIDMKTQKNCIEKIKHSPWITVKTPVFSLQPMRGIST